MPVVSVGDETLARSRELERRHSCNHNPPPPTTSAQAQWCRATVSRLTSRLATVATTCQHSSEHLVKVLLVLLVVVKTQKVTEKQQFLSTCLRRRERAPSLGVSPQHPR